MTRMVRFSPSSDLRKLQREIDEVFDSFFPARSQNGGETDTSGWMPRVDLSETEDAYMIQVDVPGVPKDDININYQEGTLSISGERKAEDRKEGSDYVRVERSVGHFYRSFSLPQTIDEEGIEASCENGVLSVRVPKAEETKPRRIEVK